LRLESNLPKKSVTAAVPAKSPSMPTSPLPLWSRPGYLVRRLHQIHSALFAEECKKFNLTPVQYGLLTVLRDRPGSDQVTLCKEVGIDRTNAAEVLARLAERGLVRRTRGEHDRRSMVAFLTKAGDALLERSYAHMQCSQDRFLAPLPASVRPAFIAMMVRLIEDKASRRKPATRRSGKPAAPRR
jgi:DNA-binding MarR family transcriptional regulator